MADLQSCSHYRKQKSFAQSSLMGLGFKKVKMTTPISSDMDKSPSAVSLDPISTVCSPSLSTATSNSSPSEIDTSTPDQHLLKITRCCDGVFPLNEKSVRDHLGMFYKFCPHNRTSSKYVIKMVGNSDQPNFYSKTCSGEGVPWTNKGGAGIRCNGCQDLWKTSGLKLRQTPLKNTGSKLRSVVNVLHASTLTESDAEVLDRFTHNKDADLNERGTTISSIKKQR
jgi:hypothetical protein